MLLKEKFPHLKEIYSSKNDDPFDTVEYKSIKKMKWSVCERDHILCKTALEIQRYPDCPSCDLIEKSDLKYEESLSYLYPEIASLVSEESRYAPDAIRPDSKTKSMKWKDTEEKVAVCDRVSAAIALGDVERSHFGSKKIRRDRRKGKTEVQKKPKSHRFSDIYPEYASWCKSHDANTLTVGSSKKVQWECTEGHKFTSSVRDFIKRTHKCTVCSGIACVTGVNDVKTLHPEISKFIHFPNPSTITLSYSGDVEFKCDDCGYSWVSDLQGRMVTLNQKVNCPACIGRIVYKGYNDLLSFIPSILDSWHSSNTLSPDQVTRGGDNKVFLSCSTPGCKNIIATYPYAISRTPMKTLFLCSSCGSSSGERELGEFIERLGFELVRNDRKILSGKEIDIYIPEKKIAIEFNGIYWHSEVVGRNRNYHHDKWKKCKEQGIQLITVWEDDWRDQRVIVERMIENKLGVSNLPKVMARKTKVSYIDDGMARNFFDDNHLQGHANGCHTFGLISDDGSLVSAMSVRKSENVVSIIRYASSCNVQGGFSKILSFIVSFFDGVSSIETFSDNETSTGRLYETNGFLLSEEISPDYKYVYQMKRFHKFNFRKKRFKEDDNLQYTEGMTEKELAQLNGIYRVWDSGKSKWILDVGNQPLSP